MKSEGVIWKDVNRGRRGKYGMSIASLYNFLIADT